VQLDKPTKQMLQELGRAINEAVADSDDVSDIISQIKNSGYDILLMLDAIVVLNPQRTEASSEITSESNEQQFLKSLKIRLDRSPTVDPDSLMTIAPQDAEFLKALKIKVEGFD